MLFEGTVSDIGAVIGKPSENRLWGQVLDCLRVVVLKKYTEMKVLID